MVTLSEQTFEDSQRGLKTHKFKGYIMKKFFLLFLALGAVAFAGEADGESMIKAYSVVAAGVGLGLAAAGGAIGMGSTTAATIAGTARNPGLGGKLMTTMFIALAMIEAQVIYTLVIALIALYANPFIG
jgi:F-type H+-transporting ATPase subunit c